MRTMPSCASAPAGLPALPLPDAALAEASAEAGGLSGCALELVHPEATSASSDIVSSGAKLAIRGADRPRVRSNRPDMRTLHDHERRRIRVSGGRSQAPGARRTALSNRNEGKN